MARKPTVTERIELAAGQYLEVSRRELATEMTSFYESGDREAMKRLFGAYRDWELRGMNGSRSPKATIQLAKENFDVVARVADGYLETRDLALAMIRVVQLPKSTSGPVSQFYRSTIGYQPVDVSKN